MGERSIKRNAGMTPSMGDKILYNQIDMDEIDGKSSTKIANLINTVFLDP